MEYPDLAEVERRPRRYWNLDGIPEFIMGGLWVVWGFAFLVSSYLPGGSRIARVYSMVFPMILVVSALGSNWLAKQLKKKYTFPRAGYVEFHDPTRRARSRSSVQSWPAWARQPLPL